MLNRPAVITAKRTGTGIPGKFMYGIASIFLPEKGQLRQLQMRFDTLFIRSLVDKQLVAGLPQIKGHRATLTP
jgi:hypothetical protein